MSGIWKNVKSLLSRDVKEILSSDINDLLKSDKDQPKEEQTEAARPSAASAPPLPHTPHTAQNAKPDQAQAAPAPTAPGQAAARPAAPEQPESHSKSAAAVEPETKPAAESVRNNSGLIEETWEEIPIIPDNPDEYDLSDVITEIANHSSKKEDPKPTADLPPKSAATPPAAKPTDSESSSKQSDPKQPAQPISPAPVETWAKTDTSSGSKPQAPSHNWAAPENSGATSGWAHPEIKNTQQQPEKPTEQTVKSEPQKPAASNWASTVSDTPVREPARNNWTNPLAAEDAAKKK